MVRVIQGKIVQKWAEGKQKLLRVSGRFELSRVRVAEGKITVNVKRKTRGNRLWFELAGVKSTVMPADYRESRRVLPCGSLLKITLQDKIDLWAFLWLIFVKFSPFYYKFKVRFQSDFSESFTRSYHKTRMLLFGDWLDLCFISEGERYCKRDMPVSRF